MFVKLFEKKYHNCCLEKNIVDFLYAFNILFWCFGIYFLVTVHKKVLLCIFLYKRNIWLLSENSSRIRCPYKSRCFKKVMKILANEYLTFYLCITSRKNFRKWKNFFFLHANVNCYFRLRKMLAYKSAQFIIRALN